MGFQKQLEVLIMTQVCFDHENWGVHLEAWGLIIKLWF